MVDAAQARRLGRLGLGHGVELDVPDTVQVGFLVDEMHDIATDALDRRDIQFAGADRLGELRRAEQCRAGDGLGGVFHPQPHVADGRAVLAEGFCGEPFGLGIDHQIDRALAPEFDRYGDVPALGAKQSVASMRFSCSPDALSAANSMNSKPVG